MTEQDFLVSVGQKIRKLRKAAGMTQKEVAQKAGIQQGTLSNFEKNGGQIKGVDIIKRIVEATGHTMSDLFSEAEKKTAFTDSSATPCPSQKRAHPTMTPKKAFGA